MKKVITALMNEQVNNKLKEYDNLEILMNDIQYQEGIFEALEIYSKIDYIILSELISGKYNLKELINKIREIEMDLKIILILKKENKELENYLISKGNIKIFYNNSIEIKEIVKIINDKKENLEEEIRELKEIILNKKELNKREKIEENETKKIEITNEEKIKIEDEIEKEYKDKFIKSKIINEIKKIIKKEVIEKNSKIILVSGISGVGKSVFTINIAKSLEKQKNKILIIDFDFNNKSIETLFGVKLKKEKNKEYKNEIEKNIIKINSRIDLITEINFLFSNDYDRKIDLIELTKFIKEIKNNYDFILIDTDAKKYDNFNLLIKETEKIIFITEANILQLKKTKNFIKQYNDEYDIETEKICIVLNKIKRNSFSTNICKEVFKNYNILGKINLIKNCDQLINNKMKDIFLSKKIKKQYKYISKELKKHNKIKQYYLENI